jgi:hypothetical protein
VRTRLLLVLAVLAVATGCTVTSEGTPRPTSSDSANTETSADSEALPSDGAPKVENPLDVSHFEENPCDALTSEDAKELNVPATGEQSGDAIGETCHWRNSQTRGFLSITFLSGEKRGLSSVYREAKEVKFPYFESIDDVEGHPAAAYSTAEEKATIDCAVAVGVTDQLAFIAHVALSDANIGQKDPCEMAAKAARMMMRTMREAA